MRIDHLHLENFKKFAVQDFDLHPHFTLLVGENGAGKTSLLDALAVASAIWLVDPPDASLIDSGRNILTNEVLLVPIRDGDRTRFVRETHCVVKATGRIGGGAPLTWSRQIRVGGIRTSNLEAKQALQQIEAIYERDRVGEDVLCPVIAYYGAGRAWLPSNKRPPKGEPHGPVKRWSAFYDCFGERIRSGELHQWFKRETIARGNRQGRWRPGFEVVRRALLRCIPGADDFIFDADLDDMVLSINGQSQPFRNLSAGQRMMLAMVADLAIKCVTQNTHLIPAEDLEPEDEPLPRVLLQTPGVVLIDEVDIHLHPIWQRRIATDLKETFPAIQFVCTSHSPQLIGELQPEEIRLMHEGNITQPALSYGMDSNWVIEMMMGGSKCNAEVKERLESIFAFIRERNLEEAEAEALRLRGEVGNSNDIQRAVSMIERIKLLGK